MVSGGFPWLGSHSFAHGAPQKVVVMPGCPVEALRSLWEQRQDFICHQLCSNPGFCLRNPRQSLPDPVMGGSAIPSPGCRWRAGTQPGGDGAPEPPRCIQGCSHPCKPPPCSSPPTLYLRPAVVAHPAEASLPAQRPLPAAQRRPRHLELQEPLGLGEIHPIGGRIQLHCGDSVVAVTGTVAARPARPRGAYRPR